MNRDDLVKAAATAFWGAVFGDLEGEEAPSDVRRGIEAALAAFEEAQKPSNVRNGEHSEGDYEAGYEEGFHHGRSTPGPQGEPSDAAFNIAAQRFYEASGLNLRHTLKPEIVAGVRAAWAALRAAGVTAEEPGPVTDAQRRSVLTDFLTYRLIPTGVREYLEGYLEAMDDE